jgi:glycosyltransferase involved in cell wall biosynthesis
MLASGDHRAPACAHAERVAGTCSTTLTRRGRLAVVPESHFRVRQGQLFAPNDTFFRFVEAFDPYFDRITLCSPAVADAMDGTTGYRVTYPFELAPTQPYGTWAGYAKHLPGIALRNFAVFQRVFARSDLVWIRHPSPNGLVAFLAARRVGVPTFLYLVSNLRATLAPKLDASHAIHRLAMRAMLTGIERSTDYMARRTLTFVVGSELFDQYRKVLGARADRLRMAMASTVHPGDVCERSDTCGDRPIRLLCVGRVGPEKQIPTLVDATALLVRNGHDVHLDIVGSGEDERRVRAAIEVVSGDEGMTNRIRLHGQIADPQRLDEVYRRADVFVLASISEGFPKVFVEAMARGLPIVSTSVGGIPGGLAEGKNALLVPPRDPGAIAGAVARLIQDGALRREMVANNLAYAREHTAAAAAHRMMEAVWEAYPWLR